MQTICHHLKSNTKIGCTNAALFIAFSLSPFWGVGLNVAPAAFAQGAADVNAAAGDSSSDPSIGEAGKLESILTKSLTALGGEEGIAQLASNYCVFGKEFERPGSLEDVAKLSSAASGSSSYRLLRKGPKWRFDHERAAANNSQAGEGVNNWTEGFNGEAPWVQASGKVEDAVMDNAKLLNLESTLPASFLLEAARNLNKAGGDLKVALGARTNFHDSPCYPLLFSSVATGENFTLYIEEKNYTVLGLAFKLGGVSGASRAIEILYSEYRPVSGSLYPYKEVRLVDNQVEHAYLVSDVNINQVAGDHDFDRPGGSFKLSKTIVIPFDYAQKEILVKGRLNNGEELDFLFDTGASDTIIDRRVAAENFLQKEGTAEMGSLSGRVTTSTSSIGRLELGNLIVNDIEARILDLSSQSRHLGRRLGGIIGTNVISRYVVTIDYGKATLTVNDSDSFVRPADALPVTFLRKSAPVVKVRLGGKEDVMMLVDTGAAFNNLPSVVAAHYVGADGPARHMTEGEGLDGRPVRLGKVLIDTVAIAGRPVHKVEFTYTLPYAAATPAQQAKSDDTKTESGGFFATTNLGILGNPFLENFVCILDYKFQRMLLKGSATLKVRSDIEQSIEAGDHALVEKREFRGAEVGYQRALSIATASGDRKNEARVLGRIGSLRRIMAKDLSRPEHSKASYDYFVKAQDMAKKAGSTEVEGRILADWSLLYLDNGQMENAKQTMDRALVLAPQDADVLVDCAVQLSRARRFPEMQRYVEKALFLDPSNWQALWYQVKLSETFGDGPKMVATLKDIVKYFPWSQIAKDKLRAMETPAPVAATNGNNGAPTAGTTGTTGSVNSSNTGQNAGAGQTSAPPAVRGAWPNMQQSGRNNQGGASPVVRPGHI